MATLALFTRPLQANTSHRVLAPGGFERWHFDAEDRSGAYRLAIDFYEGFPFYPAYLRRYHRYLRSPTRISPPLPQEYRAVSFTLFDAGKPIARLFRLASDFGANAMRTERDGTIHVELRGAPFEARRSGTTLLDQQTLTGEFVFSPSGASSKTESLDPLADASEYSQYQVSRSIGDVRGDVHVYGQGTGLPPIDLRFEGRGLFDHDLGLSPMSECLTRVMYGRVLLADRALVLEVMEEESPAMTRGELVQLDARGEQNLDAGEMKIGWHATPLHVGAPPQVSFSDQLDLSNPRVLDSNAVSAWVLYDAIARGEKGSALCEVIHPMRVGAFVQGMWLRRWFGRANSVRDERAYGSK